VIFFISGVFTMTLCRWSFSVGPVLVVLGSVACGLAQDTKPDKTIQAYARAVAQAQADLDAGRVERVALDPPRRIWDGEWIDAAGMTPPDLDAAIRAHLDALPFPVAGAVVRQVVRDVPRALAQGLDHEALRAVRAAALHFHLDLRRPEPRRAVGVGSPGVRQRLADLVADYLGRRPLDADLDRERLVALGRGYLDEVERALLEGEA